MAFNMKPNRKRKRSDSIPTLDLEEIIGLTTKNSNGLASNISTGDCIYLAGCAVVIYNVDSRTQSQLIVSARMPKALSCVAASQDGRYIASGESGDQPAVLIWDYINQALISELKGHQYGVTSIAFSPNGKHMVSAGFPRDGYLCLWDWRSGALVAKLKASSLCSTIASVCFSSDAKCFVTAGKKHLKFWKVESTKHQSNVRISSLPLDGKLANLGCQRGSSFVSVASPTRTASNLIGSDRAGKFYPIYALTDTGVLCLLHSGSINKWVDLKVEKSFALTVSNKLIACACSNGVVQLLTVDTLKYAGSLLYANDKECHEVTNMGHHTNHSKKGFQHTSTLPDAIACQFSASEKLVVIFGDHSLSVWEIQDGCKILSCSADRFHDVSVINTGARHHNQVASQGAIYDMAIDPVLGVAATVGQDKINTFNITAGKLVRTFKQHGDFGHPIKVNIDPSCSYLVCSFSNNSICIYDFTSGELVAKALGHGEVITGVIFLPDCNHIISVDGDGCIFLWKIPALLSSKIFHRMKEHADTESAISMEKPLAASNENILYDSKHTCTVEKSVQAVQKLLFQEGNTDELSAFKFSISRLPKWAQAKLITEETVPADPEPTSTQCQQVDMGLCSSIVDNGGTSVSTCPEVQRLRRRDLVCTDVPKTSFGTHTSQSSPLSNEIPSSFTMDNRWLTIHTVCFDPLNSPEERDLKDAMLPAPVPKALPNPAVERVQNSDSMEIALGAPVMRRDLLVEPPYETSNRLVNDSQVLFQSESTSNTVDNLLKKEGQLNVHKSEACSAVARDKQLHSCTDEIMANANVKEKTDFLYRGNDLFSQHFGNLSKAVKLEGRKSSTRRSYSGHCMVRDDHLIGCKKLFDTPSQNLGAEALNNWDEIASHSSSRGPPIKGLGERLSDACDKDVKNSTGSLVSPACVIPRSDSTSSSVKDTLMNMEGPREKYQMEGIPQISEVQEVITGCKKALLSVDAAAQHAHLFFNKLETLLSRQDAIAGPKTQFYAEATELLPSIKEKVNALADLVQSGGRNSYNNGAEASGFEPILGKFAGKSSSAGS
ncbi:hypothetical protein NE237_004992 [Protea cynaroides]|uniref:Mitogen-activated protein kinase-binding protein 1 n=1 Tax=Protea cynaroides TaxID=273540 RepID=A0A9Q0QU19_9MAGN|nr:hypothetical protein NE237_004992 [Protea cynaroides]